MICAQRGVLEDDDELADEGRQHRRDRLRQLDRPQRLARVSPIDRPASRLALGQAAHAGAQQLGDDGAVVEGQAGDDGGERVDVGGEDAVERSRGRTRRASSPARARTGRTRRRRRRPPDRPRSATSGRCPKTNPKMPGEDDRDGGGLEGVEQAGHQVVDPHVGAVGRRERRPLVAGRGCPCSPSLHRRRSRRRRGRRARRGSGESGMRAPGLGPGSVEEDGGAHRFTASRAATGSWSDSAHRAA